MAVEAYNDQALRRRHRRRSPVSSPAKIPHATHGNGESQHRREGGEPTPMSCARHFDSETEPLRQKPEPQREECRAYRNSGDRGWPVLFMRGYRNVSGIWVCHNSSRFALTSWLLCDPCNSIAESDQVFPDQVIDDQRGRKHDREKFVVDLHHSEIGEAVVCGMQESQAATEQESSGDDDEGQNCTMNAERQACALARSQVQHIPDAEQVRDDRHRKDDHSLHWYRDVVNKSRYEERRQGNQQKRRRHRDSRHVGAQVWMAAHNPSLLQVVREHKNQPRKRQQHHRAQANQGPVIPGHSYLPGIDFAQNVWPQIPSQFSFDWGKGLLQHLANLTVLVFGHVLVLMFFHSGLIPAWFKRLRKMRTARNTRSFTAPTEVPKALAISS